MLNRDFRRIDKVKSSIWFYEKPSEALDHPMVVKAREEVRRWKEWKNMSPAQQFSVRQEWENYLKLSKGTPSYVIFLETREAGKERDLKRMGELKNEAENYLLSPTLKQPKFPDPVMFEHSEAVRNYVRLTSELRTLESMSVESSEL